MEEAWPKEKREAWLVERAFKRRNEPKAKPPRRPRTGPPLAAIRDPDAPLVLMDGRSVVTQRLSAVAHHVGGEPRKGADPESDDWVGGVRVQLHIEVPGPRTAPRCLGLEVSPYEGGRVTGELLRIPVDRLMRRAVLAATIRVEPGEGEQWYRMTTTELPPGAREELARQYQPRRRRQGSSEQQAASVYREARAGGKSPTKAVADEMLVDRSTARRYVKQAVEKGLLDPSERLDQAEGARSRAASAS